MGVGARDAIQRMFDESNLDVSEAELAALDAIERPLIQHVGAWGPAFYSLYVSRLLERSLAEHARTLERLSKANERNQCVMVWLTVAIAVAALAEVLVAILF